MKKFRNKGTVPIVQLGNFSISQFLNFSSRRRAGMTLLLVILIISALLSVSLSIVTVVLGELRIAGEMTDSFIALYAADEGMERLLYDDRIAESICPGSGSCSYGPVTASLSNGACYTARLSRTGNDTTIISTGEFRCGSPVLSVRRAFQATYTRFLGGGPGPGG